MLQVNVQCLSRFVGARIVGVRAIQVRIIEYTLNRAGKITTDIVGGMNLEWWYL